MNRLTKDDVNQMGMVDLAHNQAFIKNGEAWFRDFDREISARDLVKEMFDFYDIEHSTILDEFDEDIMYSLEDGYETITGIIALFYRALWSMADVREKLKAYEDIGLEPEEVQRAYYVCAEHSDNFRQLLSESYELKEYKNLEEQGRLIKLPAAIGDTVYIIEKCENIDSQLDGSLYDDNGGYGTATGYYCPYEGRCPHDELDDCESLKGRWAIFRDTVVGVSLYYEDYVSFGFENCRGKHDEDFGKTVFLTREEAERALESMKK